MVRYALERSNNADLLNAMAVKESEVGEGQVLDHVFGVAVAIHEGLEFVDVAGVVDPKAVLEEAVSEE